MTVCVLLTAIPQTVTFTSVPCDCLCVHGALDIDPGSSPSSQALIAPWGKGGQGERGGGGGGPINRLKDRSMISAGQPDERDGESGSAAISSKPKEVATDPTQGLRRNQLLRDDQFSTGCWCVKRTTFKGRERVEQG